RGPLAVQPGPRPHPPFVARYGPFAPLDGVAHLCGLRDAGTDVALRFQHDRGARLHRCARRPRRDRVRPPAGANRGGVVSHDGSTEVRVTSSGVTAGPSFERRDLDRMDDEARDRRPQLWRDTAFLLSGLVLALLAANLVLPQLAGSATGSPSPIPTGFVIGGPGAGTSPGPGATTAPTSSAGTD